MNPLKRKLFFTFILLFSVLLSQYLFSQTNCGKTCLEESLKAYKTGNFNEVLDKLNPCLQSGFDREELIQAYRLLTMTYIALDDFDRANRSVESLLQIDPKFSTTVFDPPQFINLIDHFKQPIKSIVTASRQLEPITEAPVPVTLITEEMIEAIGANTLKEVLITYVPGMTGIEDHNEVNIAMHGVYSSSQQKILIMLNGHRLNCRAYSEANPDFSISLDKVKQIEVLRGPASSLYGNVALTSVINIITKEGNEVNGAELQLGAGNYGQTMVSLLYGQGFIGGNNILIWGNYYRSDGEEIFIAKENDHSPNPKEGHAIVGGFKNKPSYDIGMVFKTQNLSIFGNIRYCKYIEPFSAGGITGEVYNYSDYRTLMGVGPGLGSGFGHLDVKYEKELKNIELLLNAYFDNNIIDVNFIIDPSVKKFGKVNWDEYSYGGIIQLRKNYNLGNFGKGNIIFGGQFDKMKVYDSFFLLGLNGEFTTMVDSSGSLVLETGTESIYSGFIQIKHKFNKKLIINVGARYDNKFRHKGKNVDNLSPRLSAIYIPDKRIDFKLSFSQSFVDAPYWYRYNSLPSYLGSSNLLPEYLTALQFTTGLHFNNRKINYELNTFYNALKDFIYRNPNATGDEPRYYNAGKLNLAGIENEINYLRKSFNIRANFTWQYVINASDYPVSGDKIHNVPTFSGNFICNINPVYSKFENFWFNLTIRYVGKQISPVNTFKNGIEYFDDNNYVEDVFIVNTGILLKDFYNFLFDVRINNLFDVKYKQGGSVEFPYPQQGRWFMIKLGYKIN
jgi:iron complex outermembrane receptor protein